MDRMEAQEHLRALAQLINIFDQNHPHALPFFSHRRSGESNRHCPHGAGVDSPFSRGEWESRSPALDPDGLASRASTLRFRRT